MMTNRIGILFLGLAAIFGLAAAWIAGEWVVQPSTDTSPQVATSPVVVARVDVETAATLDKPQLELAEWPTQHLPQGAFTSIEAMLGRTTRRPLVAGEPILESALFSKGAEGGLPALIHAERRAVSVKVDSVVGVAGFVKPGARVDVLATLRSVNRQRPLPYSKVILQDIPVLAIDQKLEQARNGDPEVVNVVTLQVDPEQAQHLIYAAHEGRLQLALRAPGDEQVVKTKRVGVSEVLGTERRTVRRASRPTTRVQIIRGSKVETKTF